MTYFNFKSISEAFAFMLRYKGKHQMTLVEIRNDNYWRYRVFLNWSGKGV